MSHRSMRAILYSLACMAVLVACRAPAPERAESSDAELTSAPAHVLVAMSSADFVWVVDDRTGEQRKTPAGYFLAELGYPLKRMLDAGFAITFASPGGVRPVVDAVSDRPSILYYHSPAEFAELKALVAAQPGMTSPTPIESLSAVDLEGFDALFVPGGHAPMTDLSRSPAMAAALRHFHDRGKPIAAICHGPAALLSAREESRPWIFAGYRMTSLSDHEERKQEWFNIYAEDAHLPWYLESALRSAGGAYERNLIPFTSRTVRDRELLTAQNPQSSKALGAAFVEMVGEYARAR